MPSKLGVKSEVYTTFLCTSNHPVFVAFATVSMHALVCSNVSVWYSTTPQLALLILLVAMGVNMLA